MTEEERKQLISLICKLTYLEWLKLSHLIQVIFNSEINSVSNKLMLDTETLSRRVKEDLD